jgi:DNA-directed RNA polymerase subunit N (RpoN/RPB10)
VLLLDQLTTDMIDLSSSSSPTSTGDLRLLDEAISSERETLDLRPKGHPHRSMSCVNLAASLWTRYQRTGDADLLDEAINLEREALDLHPEGHPHHSISCVNLALSLRTRYEHTGDVNLLDEAINLEREALDLHPEGHPHHSISCGNLALSLRTRYEHTGDVNLLDEAINLERETLDLHPEGHPHRSMSCGSLALSLRTRYERTGDADLLDEAINLEREALYLRPKGHPDRSMSCGNLALSLWTRYRRTGDADLLDEAINLEREVLDLLPEGHPDRSTSSGNLALSLRTLYEHTGDVGLLDEALNLEREALYLRPTGHPDRSTSCGNLAVLLRTHYKRTGDEAVLHEMFALLHEALPNAHIHLAWRHAADLAWMHLLVTGPFYNVNTASKYLLQALENEHDDIGLVVETLRDLIDKIWNCNSEGKHIKLIAIYQRLVNLLPLLVHPALGLQLQLQAMKGCARLGSDAFVNAVLAGDCLSGFEALELAQSVIWSQSLHRRDPQLKDVPKPLANMLHELLHAMATNSDVESHHSKRVAHTQHDRLHVNSSRLYALVRNIRAVSGLDRFMLGETFETLCTVASQHPVVVLVSARGQHYALIMAKMFAQRHMLISLDLSDDDLANLSSGYGSTKAHRSAAIPEQTLKGDRVGFKKTADASSGPLDGQLQTLWHKVVKPVLDHLGLEAGVRNIYDIRSALISIVAIARSCPSTLALVCHRDL